MERLIQTIKEYFSISTLVVIGLFITTTSVHAATFSILGPKTISVGETFKATVVLDTEGDDVNALEGKLVYTKELIELTNISTTQSIVSLWAVPLQKNTAADASFAGGIPGGYTGEGNVAVLTFTARNLGDAEISITSERVLKSDGKGTPVSISTNPYHVRIIESLPQDVSHQGESKPEATNEKAIDVSPPEPFSLYVAKDSSMFKGKWFLVGQAVDKESSIAGYRVYESSHAVAEDEAYTLLRKEGVYITGFPYVLQDQSRKSYITVAAYDENNNVRLSSLAPSPEAGYDPRAYHAIILLLLIALTLEVYWRVKHRWR